MMTPHRLFVAVAFVVAIALPLSAQDVPAAIRTAVACAPQTSGGAPPSDAPRIIGSQDTVSRMMYTQHDVVVIDAGTASGIAIGQKFAVRKIVKAGYPLRTSPKPLTTAGWLTIVAVNEKTALGSVGLSCDGIEPGDYLQPWVEPVIPSDVNRNDPAGELDFSSPARVVFGDYGRVTAGRGELVIADSGQGQGVMPGARFAIYRDVHIQGVPLSAVGEAIVISADDSSAVLRLTDTRDAVQSGDLLIPRKR
jgi:hypothetical protein